VLAARVSLALLFGVLSPARVHAFDLSPYSAFQTMSQAELATLQVKLTYVGPIDHPVATLMFTSSTSSPTVVAFAPYYRAGVDYGIDGMGVVSFRASVAEMKAVIDAVAKLPSVTDGGVDSTAYISFSMLKSAGGTSVFESLLNQRSGRDLMAALLTALPDNPPGRREIFECGCRMSILPLNPPLEVTQQLTVTAGGFHLDQKSGTYVSSVKVTNSSLTRILGPVSFLPGISGANVLLLGEDGFTCLIRPAGAPYLTLQAGAGLSPGASANLELRISNPSNQPVGLHPRFFAGDGTR
jgi:hypothetical protein